MASPDCALGIAGACALLGGQRRHVLGRPFPFIGEGVPSFLRQMHWTSEPPTAALVATQRFFSPPGPPTSGGPFLPCFFWMPRHRSVPTSWQVRDAASQKQPSPLLQRFFLQVPHSPRALGGPAAAPGHRAPRPRARRGATPATFCRSGRAELLRLLFFGFLVFAAIKFRHLSRFYEKPVRCSRIKNLCSSPHSKK